MTDQFSLSLFEAIPQPKTPPPAAQPERQPQVPEGKEEKAAIAAAPEPVIYTISELNKMIKASLESEFQLVWLRGEISNFKSHTSGHFYFALKDQRSSVKAVMFKGYNKALRFRPEDGMEVIVRGRISVYEPRGDYQIMCEVMEPAGLGALQKAFEQLKAKLQAEGLFDAARKRAIPKLPNHIVIVTSPTGAVIRDMLNVLGRRYRGATITVVPTIVQGEQAPAQIVKALQMAAQLKEMDVLIVGRGGGSMEDLWAFNDESVARAVSSFPVPVISAVGHEVDFTICDFVADLRAPTPSAAAELVAQSAAELGEQIARSTRSLRADMMQILQQEKRQLQNLSQRLVDPKRKLQDLSMRCDDLVSRLEQATLRWLSNLAVKVELWRGKLGTPEVEIRRKREQLRLCHFHLLSSQQKHWAERKNQFEQQVAVLESLSPLKVVSRGYAIVTTENNEIVKDSAHLQVDQTVAIRFARGRVKARVSELDVKENDHGI